MSDDLTRLTDEDRATLRSVLHEFKSRACDDGCSDGTYAAVESILAARTAALIDRAERAERERDEAIDSKDRWRLRAKSAQSELSDIRTTIGSGPERWTEADSISVYRTRAEDAESELAALRAAVTGLADQWEERAAVRESPSVRREWTTGDGERMSSTGPHNPRNAAEGAIFDLCASRLRAMLTDEGDNQ